MRLPFYLQLSLISLLPPHLSLSYFPFFSLTSHIKQSVVFSFPTNYLHPPFLLYPLSPNLIKQYNSPFSSYLLSPSFPLPTMTMRLYDLLSLFLSPFSLYPPFIFYLFHILLFYYFLYSLSIYSLIFHSPFCFLNSSFTLHLLSSSATDTSLFFSLLFQLTQFPFLSSPILLLLHRFSFPSFFLHF